jgi:hypothetical protein
MSGRIDGEYLEGLCEMNSLPSRIPSWIGFNDFPVLRFF